MLLLEIFSLNLKQTHRMFQNPQEAHRTKKEDGPINIYKYVRSLWTLFAINDTSFAGSYVQSQQIALIYSRFFLDILERRFGLTYCSQRYFWC